MVSKKSLQVELLFPGDCLWFETDTSEVLRASYGLFKTLGKYLTNLMGYIYLCSVMG